jgi:tetratricopeptide (TPR) repeat protein
MHVAWKSSGQRTVSRAETVGLGGLFLHTDEPATEGSVIELLFDLKSGEIRARAIVRHSCPGRGMGVQFVQMQPADRARLDKFLANYKLEEEIGADPLSTLRSRAAAIKNRAQAGSEAEAPKTPASELFEREMRERLDFVRNGTYYQLLSVAPHADLQQIKKAFHETARKFHPDYHMEHPLWMNSLKELMAAATEAYKVLSDENKRATYDARLTTSGAYQLRRNKTAAQENIELYVQRANEYIRAKNFTGSVVWLRKCVEIAPDEAKYHAMLAHSLGTIPQFRNEAIREYERAVNLDPWNPTVFFQFAELYQELEMPSRARPLYEKILEINPIHSRARERLAELQANVKA